MIRILFILLLLSCSRPVEVKVIRVKENDSLIKEIERRDKYLRVMVDRLIKKDYPIDSTLGKTIIEIGKL